MNAIKESLKFFLLKAFEIREGEYGKALLMQAYIFLIISTLLIIKPTVYGLFLSKFGAETLPWAFIAVAVVAALVSSLYARSLKKNSLLKINIITLALSILILLGFGFLLIGNVWEAGVIFLFYLFVALFGVLSASQFWILANILFNPREAKRLFGFIGAGAIAGGIFGGYLTSLLTRFFPSEILLFLCALMLAACIPIVWYLWKWVLPAVPEPLRQKRKSQRLGDHPLRLILSSRHLTYMASIVGVSVIVAKLVDYQFSAISAARIPDPDELAAFMGFWFSTLNLVSLGIQLFITRRVVGVFGVGTSLFFLPGGIMVGALLMLFLPELWVAVFIKIADGSLKQSINKASMELLALPIPQEVKNQTKTFIDVLIDSIATGIGGLILIFLVSGLDLSTRFISLMILLMLGLWVFLVWKVRKEYLRSFQEKVRQVVGKTPKKELDLSQESVIGGLRKTLLEGTENQKRFVLNKLMELQHPQLFEAILSQLNDPSPAVQAAAIHNLYLYRSNPVVDQIIPLLETPDEAVKIAAFGYLVHFLPGEQVPELIEEYLQDADYRVRGAALISICVEAGRNVSIQNAYALEQRIHQWLEEQETITDEAELKFTKIHILQALGRSPMRSFALFIKNALKDPDPEVQGAALLTAGQTMDPFWIAQIIPFLDQDSTRTQAQEALGKYGISLLGHLPPGLLTEETRLAQLRAIPAVIESLNSQQSVYFLFELLEHNDREVEMNALRSLNTLKIQFPHLHFDEQEIIPRILEEARLFLESLSVLHTQMHLVNQKVYGAEQQIQDARKSLISLMERRLDGRLERIFRLLGLKYPPEDIFSIYQGIQKGTQEQRALAIEFLDNLLENKLKSLLMPIVETAMLDVVSAKTLQHLNLKIPDEASCFRFLLERKDTRIRIAVLYLISQLREAKYLPLLNKYTDDPNPKIRDFVQKAITATVG